MWIWFDRDVARWKKMEQVYRQKGYPVQTLSREQDFPKSGIELVILTRKEDAGMAAQLSSVYGVPVILSVPGLKPDVPPEGCAEMLPYPPHPAYLEKWAKREERALDAPKEPSPALNPAGVSANDLMEQMIRQKASKQTFSLRGQTVPFVEPLRPLAKRATILTITGVKGGVGKSTFSILLARNLHQKGQRTVLVDLDNMGNLARLLRVDPIVSTDRFEVLSNTLNDAELEQNLIRTGYGFWVIPKGQRPMGLSADGTRRLMYLLSRYADTVILDTHPSRMVCTVEAMREADVVLGVTGTDRSTWAEIRDFFSLTEKPVHLVLSRTREKPGVLHEISQILESQTGYPVLGYVPEDDKLFEEVQAGEMLMGSPAIETAMKQIRLKLWREDVQKTETEKEGMRTWRFGRSKGTRT
ncbi:MinD/ParA family ATP-binding protein [Alicyclobacillus tolerans]|uniref:MinD/ParA family ATP-binding protein n=1 Tax=Alicyclobacillus tolerans TaxID=90970 RepID=UPI003B7ACEC8